MLGGVRGGRAGWGERAKVWVAAAKERREGSKDGMNLISLHLWYYGAHYFLKFHCIGIHHPTPPPTVQHPIHCHHRLLPAYSTLSFLFFAVVRSEEHTSE